MTTPMRTPMTVADIERRLRFAAPDEPAVLPALALPISRPMLGRAAVRMRVRPAPQERALLLIVLVAMFALLATAVAVGALRILEKKEIANACMVSPDQAADPTCLSLGLPEGWTRIAAGQLQAPRFEESGLAVEYVEQVIASIPLGGCASPGGPPPTGVPVGSNTTVFPAPTPDAGLACVRTATLPDNGIRVVTIVAMRISGVELDAPIPDNSEPTEAAGWTLEIAGRPARLQVSTAEVDGHTVETRVWDILMPRRIDTVLRIRADLAGPDLESGRATVEDMVQKVHFLQSNPAPLEASKANDALRALLDQLDRTARESRSDFYACFPREPGSSDGTITGGPWAPLPRSLDVTCSSSISASRAGLWRVVLDVSWKATKDYDADTIRTEFFTTGEEFGDTGESIDLSGGLPFSLSGRSTPPEGAEALFPMTAELPPPLEGPLDFAPGTLVEMLWPGAWPEREAGSTEMGGDGGAPQLVGTHLYVISGPEMVDGDEWYRVQWDNQGIDSLEWVPGTGDGRPLLREIEPACPSGDVTVDEIAWLIAAERLQCFGDRDVTFAGAEIVPLDPSQIAQCAFDGEAAGPCPTGEPAWLTDSSTWRLYGAGGPAGPERSFAVWVDPALSLGSGGLRGRITGHFDDGDARGCLFPTYDRPVEPGATELQELICRERFVVTAVEERP
jgi:hypothetical protein